MSSVIDYKLPSDWSESELDKLIAKNTKITYGVVQPGPKDPDGVPFIRGGDIFNGKIAISKLRTISTEVSNAYKRTLLKGGELLMSLVGYPGEVAIVPSILAGANIARQAAYIKLGDTVDDKYVMHYLRSEIGKYYLFQKSTGSAQQVINLVDLKEVTILLPPLPEQQKIAAILSSVDEVIEKTQAQINKLKDLKTGMMQELLSPREGQAANINITQGESKNSLYHTEFKDSPLGRIPVGWDAVPLSQLVKSERPITYGIVQTGPNIESGIPCVRVVDLMTDAMSLQKMIRTSSTINESYRRTILQSNDIMFALRGSIGHVRMTSPQLVGANLTRGVALISANDSICSKFLLWAIRSPSVRSMIMDGVNGSALQEIPLGNLRNVYIPLPPNEEQIKISKTIDSVEENLTKRRSKLKNYQSLKKALMQDLLTGKVRVKVDAA
jgi:type I restriction enzyme S subunit